jgi:hypothetical protein
MPPRERPDFVAEIAMLPAGAGSHQASLRKGEWRIVLGVGDEYWSAMLDFDGEPAPGTIFEANVWLLLFDVALSMFEVGVTFTVWEGEAKACGTVKRVARGAASDAGPVA